MPDVANISDRGAPMAGKPSITPVRPRDEAACDVEEGDDSDGGEGGGDGIGEVRGGWEGSWTMILLVKSSLARGVGGLGGLERASTALLDLPATCQMSQVNWLMKRR